LQRDAVKFGFGTKVLKERASNQLQGKSEKNPKDWGIKLTTPTPTTTTTSKKPVILNKCWTT
jgi:hypothetical protein